MNDGVRIATAVQGQIQRQGLASVADEQTGSYGDGPRSFLADEYASAQRGLHHLIELDQWQMDLIHGQVCGGAGNVEDIYPLSPIQEGILFHHLLSTERDTYLLSTLFEVRPDLPVERLIGALQKVVDRHAFMRTAVLWDQLPQPVQVVSRRAAVAVEEIQPDPQCSALDRLSRIMRSAQRGMDLSKAPLVRLFVVRGGEGAASFVLLQIHHIVCDHRTKTAVLAEVIAYLQGRGTDLPLPVPYRNHLANVLAYARSSEARLYFAEKFGDVSESSAPFGVTDVSGGGDQAEEATLELPTALTGRLRAQARRARTSASILFHAAWALVVARTSARDDVVFGTVLATLPAGLRGQQPLGIAVNTLPLRLRLRDVSARELVAGAHRELIGLSHYSMAPLTMALRASGMTGDAPLFTSLLNCLSSASDSHVENHGDEVGLRIVLEQGARSNYPLSLEVNDHGSRISISALSQVSMKPQRILDYMSTAITSIVDALEFSPQTPAISLQVLPVDEFVRVTDTFNATKALYPLAEGVHRLVERQAELTPDALAVVAGDRQFTYGQLNRRANQLARCLMEFGVGQEVTVGVYFRRGVDLVVALLGILKAGGAYVPIDTSYPAERQKYILDDAGVKVLLTEERLRACLPPVSARVFTLDTESGMVDRNSFENVSTPDASEPTSLAYVVYTSGSTGAPKGVMVEHRNLTNLVNWHCNAFGIEASSRMSSVASIGFDAASWEIWPPLTAGARLVFPPGDVGSDPEKLISWWEREPLTISFLPTPLAELAFSRGSHSRELRTLLVGGDRLRSSPGAQSFTLVNNYGPTESTVVATSGEVRPDDPVLHIGRPISNTSIYILNAHKELAPVGVAGELYIGGAGVARGYLNRPDLTAERFVVDPFSADTGARLYRTGDLARWREDGRIEFLGRNDKQVKIRGYRIELREIEVQLASHPQVQDALVVARQDLPGPMYLAAYYLARGQSNPTAGELQLHLKQILPPYMIPASIVRLEKFPLTPNGKVDERALPKLQIESDATARGPAPRGEIEQALAVIWEELLQTRGVGRDDVFFDIGGHSLLAVRLVDKLNRAFSCTLKVADIYRNPALREMAARIVGYAAEDEFIDLEREAQLDDDIVARRDTPLSKPKRILLTGATGFVGRFLLSELLKQTDATIYCLVRGSSRDDAMRRLRSAVSKWDIDCDPFDDRVIAVPGDLRAAGLGIESVTYDDLAQKIDSIYHCATSMNHLETYEMAKDANVGSAKALLRFATDRRAKLVNYLSTLGVFGDSGGPRRVDERTSIAREMHRKSRGYVASKWVAERVFEIARDRNIPCNIFRLGLIWADTQLGRYDELQNVYRIFKSCLISGKAIEHYKYAMAPTPVDYAARSIVFLGAVYSGGGGVFHISGADDANEDVFERCNEVLGTSLELKSYFEWIGEIMRLHQAGISLPAVPVVESAFSMDEDTFNRRLRSRRSSQMRIDCSRTCEELEAAGIVAPVITDELLRRYVRRMLSQDEELKKMMSSGERKFEFVAPAG